MADISNLKRVQALIRERTSNNKLITILSFLFAFIILLTTFTFSNIAHAANMKDSGVKNVRIALREDSSSVSKAKEAGYEVMNVADAAKWADVMMMATPDELQSQIWKESLEGNMKPGSALGFAHGLNIHFGLIEPRKDIDIFMLAPKGPGHTVRSEYLRGGGVPSLVAVAQDSTKNALDIGLSYGCAVGGGRAGITLKEVSKLESFDESLPIMKAHGVRELLSVNRNEISLEEAAEVTINHTNQYAKRQETWFKHYVDQRVQALVLQFGEPVKLIKEELII